jgi:WhiB family redox-sensing transcriptional regulator
MSTSPEDRSVTSGILRWQPSAACHSADLDGLFFAIGYGPEPDPVRDEREARAKAYCRRCPVTARCLEYAMATRTPEGVFGGMGEQERRLAARLNGRKAVA